MGHRILRGAFEQHERHSAIGRRLPRHGERLASGHNRHEARLGDGVTLGRVADGLGVGVRKRRDKGEASREEAEEGEVGHRDCGRDIGVGWEIKRGVVRRDWW